MIKKIIIGIFLFQMSAAYSQIIIGDAIGTAVDKTSVLLEFANNNNKGLILPYVRTLPPSPTPGTLLLDSSSPTSAKVKYYNGSVWQTLSDGADITTTLTSQPATIEDPNAKTIIGAATSTADGVLVLESSTKAIVLPIVTDVQNIPSPSPGMIVYVKGTTKYFAVYNGNKWAFWIP